MGATVAVTVVVPKVYLVRRADAKVEAGMTPVTGDVRARLDALSILGLECLAFPWETWSAGSSTDQSEFAKRQG